MRPIRVSEGVRHRRTLAGGVSAAVAGSLTLLLGAAPAHASGMAAAQVTDGANGRMLRPGALRVPAADIPPMYSVVAGDTASSIAGRYGLSTVDVLALNGLDWSSIIQPGQELLLIAAAAPPASPSAPPPSVGAGSHVVTAGDTISSIASAHGVSIADVFAANGLSWSSIIYPGETLVIPGAADFELVADSATTEPEPTPAPASLPAATSPALDDEQIGNVQIIISVGRELGVSDRGIAIALGTAMQESWLRNLDWGDRDSLGLFQQRPSTGWGTETEVRDAARAARAFYGGPSDPNGDTTRGLLDIPGWEDMAFADAAQAVQISAFPQRYAPWEQPAYTWLAAYG